MTDQTTLVTTTLVPLNPLDWRTGIVDGAGRPTPEFQRRWLNQSLNNENLTDANNTNAGIITAAQAAQALINARTGFGFFAGGLMKDHELLGAGVFAENVAFASGGLTGLADVATAQIAPTSDASFTFVVLGVIVGMITFLAGEITGTVTWSPNPYTLTTGSQLQLYAPTPPDPSLSSVSATIYGTKS